MSLSNNFPTQRPTLLLDFAGARRLDPRITFTRATTATYYDGVTTALAEQNLFNRSQGQFATAAWTRVAVTVTDNNAVAPDSTNTASTVTNTATTDYHHVRGPSVAPFLSVTSGLSYTISIFAKKNTADFLQITSFEASNALGTGRANFNISTGVVGTVDGGTSSIVAVGNNWYRCSYTVTASAAGSPTIYFGIVSSASAARFESYLGLGTESILIWGTQIEQRSTATAYTATGSEAIVNYIPVLVTAPADTARFDFNPVTGQSLGLLIEEARTNLILQSENLTTTWGLVNATVTANTLVGPGGTLTADKLVEDTATNQHVASQGFTPNGSTYVFSVYLKAGERFRAELVAFNGTDSNMGSTVVNLTTGTVTSGTGTISAVGNSWYRVTTSAFTPSSGVATSVFIKIYSDAGNFSYTGNGYAGLFVWGAQLEIGTFATSYIPTTTGTVPRNKDVANMTGTNFSSWFNPSAMTIYSAAASSSGAAYTGYVYSIGEDFNNSIQHYRQIDLQPVARVRVAGVDTYGATGNGAIWTGTSVNRFALALSATSGRQASNGSLASGGDDTNISFPPMARLTIGGQGSASDTSFNGTISKIAYYDVRLSNAELQNLTAS